MGVYINMEMPQKTYAHCMLIKSIDGSVQLHVCTKNSEELNDAPTIIPAEEGET